MSSYNPAYRYGDPKPVKAPWKSGVAVDAGDLVYLDAGDSFTVKPASSLSWPSDVAAPSAPTVADGAHNVGTSLTNAATGVKVSYQFPWGEGALSSAGSVTPTAGAAIKLSGLAIPAPAIGLNVYVETSAGSGTYRLYAQYAVQPGQQGLGDQFLFGYGLGQTPPTAVTSTATDLAQYNFAGAFLGVSAQSYDGSNGSAYGINDGNLRVDTGGVYDFACASTTWVVGDLVAPAKQSAASLLDPQTVAKASGKATAIGKVVQAGTSVTTVRVALFGERSAAPHL